MKAAIEFSTTFLIGIILGMIMLFSGIAFFAKLLIQGDKLTAVFPDSLNIYVKDCLDKAQRVCIPVTKADVKTNKLNVFGIIIMNIVGEEKYFKIHVDYSTGKLEDGTVVSSINTPWTIANYAPVLVKNNEHTKQGIPIKVASGTLPGTYVFNVNVCFNDNNPSTPPSPKCDGTYPDLYNPTQQITVTVP